MVALRRPTESSKAQVATTTKSLSAVSLTKKTVGGSRSREVTQRDDTLQKLVGKADMLHDAFNSLSDVFTCEVVCYGFGINRLLNSTPSERSQRYGFESKHGQHRSQANAGGRDYMPSTHPS
ncbi:hypothetical protein PHYPSEUDO_010531 [Phytophthora pseudosyringae]|uniref:Uncharacterized protein n=1 Tax=Phytophthora pseudosyringae TaxID=221518 RepID=A0A8T1VB02_9STRA|nr:hypothetical protein PHYPSEUDO_010531 [Phytophthora pseudosyringae]